MKKTNVRVRRNGGSKSVPSQVPNKPEPQSPATDFSGKRYRGFVQSFQPGQDFGLIEPQTDKLCRALGLPSEGTLHFYGSDVMKFDTHRLSHTDSVEFSVVREADRLRAVNIRVLEACAENYESEFDDRRTVSLALAAGCRIAGFTMSDATYRRLDSAAGKLGDTMMAKGDERSCMAAFIEDAILAHIERFEQAAPKNEDANVSKTRELDLEDAVRASAALTSLLFTHVESPAAATVVPMERDTFNCGVMLLCKATNDNLLTTYYGAKKSRIAADRRAS